MNWVTDRKGSNSIGAPIGVSAKTPVTVLPRLAEVATHRHTWHIESAKVRLLGKTERSDSRTIRLIVDRTVTL